MRDFTIYHNPRCSKSRQTLALLEENGIKPEIVLYLENPPSALTLKKILKMLNLRPREILRTSEAIYRELGLADPTLSDSTVMAALLANPRLMERPIVLSGNKAVIGRPPENVLELL